MIALTRRGAIAGALAVPTLAGLAAWRWQHGDGAVLVHDPMLESGRRFAKGAQGKSLAVEGDRVRFARAALASRPALMAGVTRHADLLLIADVAAEAGYAQVASLDALSGRCTGGRCRGGWEALERLGRAAGADWAEALAAFASNPGGALPGPATASWVGARDSGLVIGWVLVPSARMG